MFDRIILPPDDATRVHELLVEAAAYYIAAGDGPCNIEKGATWEPSE